MYSIKIQKENFTIEEEITKLQKDKSGAIVSFSGIVRDFNDNDCLQGIYLDCYIDMAYKQLEKIVQQAIKNFNLQGVRVIHRIGSLAKYEQIVLIVVSSKNRREAFLGCEYIIDYLKKQAPFFKKEVNLEAKSTWLS